MTFPAFMGFTAGILQFVVAGYALRLNRLFGTARVGWSLFCAFSLLALLHLVQSLMPQSLIPFTLGGVFNVKVEVMYSLVSLLLLTGMVHMETLLKERLRVEQKEQQMRIELESQVERKTAHLTKAIEALQSEIDQRTRMEAEVRQSQTEFFLVSRRADSAELAAKVLHNVGDMLTSVNISANLISDNVKQSKIANVVHVGNLIREHAADLGNFLANDRRGQKLPLYIVQLAEHLANEQASLSTELESIRKNIQEILAMQQRCIHTAPGKITNADGAGMDEGTLAEYDFSTVSL